MYQSFRGESREVAWRLTKSVTESANSDGGSEVASSSGPIGEIMGKILLHRHDLKTWRRADDLTRGERGVRTESDSYGLVNSSRLQQPDSAARAKTQGGPARLPGRATKREDFR